MNATGLSIALVLVAAAADFTSARADEPPSERKYLLERVGDAAVVQVYADNFAKLPLRQKVLTWHLYQAALAGRDIYYDQRHAQSLAMRAVLEAIVTHPEGVDAGTLAEVRRYTKLFWLNSGPYNHLTARKFVLECTPEALAAAARAATKAGATIPTRDGETLDALLGRLRPDVLRPRVRAHGHQQDAGAGQGHPRHQRQQPLRRRDDGGPRGLRRAVSPQLAPGEAGREARRGALPDRREIRRTDRADRRAPGGGHQGGPRAHGRGAAGAGEVLPHGRDGGPQGV